MDLSCIRAMSRCRSEAVSLRCLLLIYSASFRSGLAVTVSDQDVCFANARRPIHFHRFRAKRGLTQPDTHGSFWRNTFEKPIYGPLALGFGCHYGLGIFRLSDA